MKCSAAYRRAANRINKIKPLVYDCIDALQSAGISYADAQSLRRISMTLHRWHELECGDSNDYASTVLVRGRRSRIRVSDGRSGWNTTFEYEDDGKPYLETHYHQGDSKAHYFRVPDRERGALKRLAAIMARYPGFQSYVQGDPRGCALYILRPGDVPEGSTVDSCYNRGIAVCK